MLIAALKLAFLLLPQLKCGSGYDLIDIINELNECLDASTNIIYSTNGEQLQHFESNFSRSGNAISQLIFTESFNTSQLNTQLSKKLLFILLVKEPPYGLLEDLNLTFQRADYLLAVQATKKNIESDETWLTFLGYAFDQGYTKFLLYSPHDERLYASRLFPQVHLLPSNVKWYVGNRNKLNVHGHGVRVATYNNPPRSIIYKNRHGRQIFGGYYMRLIRHFLEAINATFVPVFTQNASPTDCMLALKEERVDLCTDALASNPDKIDLTDAIRMAYANIIVANAQPLSTYRYLMAPFHTSVWFALFVYIGLIVTFMSFIYWRQQQRWIFSKFLLEAISSLLFAGFSLKDLRGRERYILFVVLFLTGFVFSTFYLGFLKSLLATEVFSAQINTFEDLIAANITIMMDEYDRSLSGKFNLPDILWQIIRIVPMETLVKHRNSFDVDYAYVLFTDRMDLYEYAQKFLRHERIRRIPINIFFLHAGFPMRKKWFLKDHLSMAWANAFASGLLQKLALDADYETVRMGWLNFLVTEYYEAEAMRLDYFVMPAIALGLGYGMALLSFGIELTAWRTRKATKRSQMESQA